MCEFAYTTSFWDVLVFLDVSKLRDHLANSTHIMERSALLSIWPGDIREMQYEKLSDPYDMSTMEHSSAESLRISTLWRDDA